MGKTNDLCIVIKTLLDTVTGATYRNNAPVTAVYPYKVFSFENVDLDDVNRDDIVLVIDNWDRSPNYKNVNAMSDAEDTLLNQKNNPTSTILPTFYRVGRKEIDDEDKELKREQIKFLIQNYER